MTVLHRFYCTWCQCGDMFFTVNLREKKMSKKIHNDDYFPAKTLIFLQQKFNVPNCLAANIRCLLELSFYSKTFLKRPLSKRPKLVFKTNYHLMHVIIFAECSPSAILSTFIKLPFVIKIFLLSIFEWPLQTGFTVH